MPAILRSRTSWLLKAMPGTSFFKVDGDQLKITLVYTVIHAIFLNTYPHSQRVLWAFRTRKSSSGNWLMVFLQIDRVFAV